jgi:hypothetical protein
MNKKAQKEIEKKLHTQKQVKWILFTGLIMIIGLLLFKYLPMWIYGKDILFDASAHIVGTCFVLYIFWFFIDQNKNLRIIYLIFSLAILIVISIQRIITKNHDEFGLILGFIISVIAISLPRLKEVKRSLKF